MDKRTKTLKHQGLRHLPLPTGPYTVGCTDLMTSYLKFGIFTRLYYPTKSCGILDRYLQWPLWLPHKQYLNGYAVRAGITPYFYRLAHKMLIGDVHIPAVWQAEILPRKERYPIIVFSHGLSGWRTTYSSICLELASHGFVVAAVEHRDFSASASFYTKQARMSAVGKHPGINLSDLDMPDCLLDFEVKDVIDGKWDPGQGLQEVGPFCHAREWMLYLPPTKDNESALRSRQLRHRAKECVEVLDVLEDINKGRYVANVLESSVDLAMFKDQMDLKKSFIAGHSFGGATAILCLATELRFKAGIILDPWMFPFFEDYSCFSMISQPFLCVPLQSFQTKKSCRFLKTLQDMHSESQFSVIRDAYHRDLCDTPFIWKYSFSLSTKMGFKIERFSSVDLISCLILDFLKSFLEKSFSFNCANFEILKKRYIISEDYLSKAVL